MSPAAHLFWRLVTHEVTKISELSNEEYVKLIATFGKVVSGERDDTPELQGRGYSPEAMKEMQKIAGASYAGYKSLGLLFRKPLHNFHSDIFSYVMLLFENYERGALPFPGSVSEQPAQIMEIFGVLDQLRSDHQESHRRKMQNG